MKCLCLYNQETLQLSPKWNDKICDVVDVRVCTYNLHIHTYVECRDREVQVCLSDGPVCDCMTVCVCTSHRIVDRMDAIYIGCICK